MIENGRSNFIFYNTAKYFYLLFSLFKRTADGEYYQDSLYTKTVLWLPWVLGLRDCFWFCWFSPSPPHFWESLPHICPKCSFMIHFVIGRVGDTSFYIWGDRGLFCWNEQGAEKRGEDPMSQFNKHHVHRLVVEMTMSCAHMSLSSMLWSLAAFL
jgi:hypothetical protein